MNLKKLKEIAERISYNSSRMAGHISVDFIQEIMTFIPKDAIYKGTGYRYLYFTNDYYKQNKNKEINFSLDKNLSWSCSLESTIEYGNRLLGFSDEKKYSVLKANIVGIDLNKLKKILLEQNIELNIYEDECEILAVDINNIQEIII